MGGPEARGRSSRKDAGGPAEAVRRGRRGPVLGARAGGSPRADRQCKEAGRCVRQTRVASGPSRPWRRSAPWRSSLAGAGGPKKKRVEPDPPKVEEAVGDLTYIQAHAGTKLEGVGLVVGLENTGVDPPPSYYRQKLLDEMKKAGVENANAWLRDPRVSMVIVRMTIPAGVSTTDRLDAEVELPPGSGTKSLAGGRLLECRLREVMVLGGVPKEGPEAATVQGPVMTGSADEPDDLKVGRVLGGGRVRKEVPFQLILNENRKSGRVAKMVETVVNQRFPQTQGVEQKGLGGRQDRPVPRTEGPAGLPPQPGPLLPGRQAPADGRQPRAPGRSGWPSGKGSCSTRRRPGIAALRLEGLGVTAAEALEGGPGEPQRPGPVLRRRGPGLPGRRRRAPTSWRRPPSASPSSAPTPSTALAATDQPAAHMKLRKLMDEPDVELRYGAFNALRTLAADDPFLGQVRVLDEPKEPRTRTRPPTRWPWPSPAPRPRNRRPEPVLALHGRLRGAADGPRRPDPALRGRDLRPGPEAAHPGRPRHRAAPAQRRRRRRHAPDQQDRPGPVERRATPRSSRRSTSGDVVRQAASLGANYPEIVSILQAASRQKNLAGPLVVDALPGNSPVYIEAELLGKDTTAKKDPALQKTELGAGDRQAASGRACSNRLFRAR